MGVSDQPPIGPITADPGDASSKGRNKASETSS